MKYIIGQKIRVHAFRNVNVPKPTFMEVIIKETNDRVKRYVGEITRDVCGGAEFQRRVGETVSITGEDALRNDWPERIELVQQELFL